MWKRNFFYLYILMLCYCLLPVLASSLIPESPKFSHSSEEPSCRVYPRPFLVTLCNRIYRILQARDVGRESCHCPLVTCHSSFENIGRKKSHFYLLKYHVLKKIVKLTSVNAVECLWSLDDHGDSHMWTCQPYRYWTGRNSVRLQGTDKSIYLINFCVYKFRYNCL